MLSCDIPNLTEMFERALLDGLSPELAERIVRMQLAATRDPQAAEKIETLFPSPKVRTLTEAEQTELSGLWETVSNSLTSEFIDSLTTDDVNQIFVDLLGDNATRFFEILAVAGYDLNNFKLVQYQHINRLKQLIEIHTNLDNPEIVADLEATLEREEKRLERRKENKDKLDELIMSKQIKSALIQTLLNIANLVDSRLFTDAEKIFTLDMADEIERVRKQHDIIKNLKAKLERAKQRADSASAKNKSKFVAAYKKLSKELGKEIKAEFKKAAKMNLELRKKKAEFLAKVYKERTGKDLVKGKADFAAVIGRLELELNKTQRDLVDLNLRNIAQDTRDVTRSTTQIIAFQARLQTIANAGQEIRVNTLIERLGTANAPTLAEAEETFGKTAYNVVIGSRERVKLPDGSQVPDMSDPTQEEIERMGQVWKQNMIDTAYAGFYSEDPADMTEESLNVIESIAMGRGLVDGSSPEAVDPTFAPTLTTEQRLAMATPGEIPEANRFDTGEEATRAIEGTIRRMYSVMGFKFFKGNIPEKLIRQILHPKLMDINPRAWADARISYLKPRKLQDIQIADQATFRKAVLQAHGGNVDAMPEFTDPGWFANNTKLISFDIETFGNVSHPTDKVDGVYAIQIRVRDGVNPPQTKLLVNSDAGLVDAKLVNAEQRKPLTPDQITSVLTDLENFQNSGFKVITHNGNNFDFPQLRKHVTDTNLLARVALRSIDLLANVTEHVPGSSWKAKTRVTGKKLKELAKNNLPERTPTTAYGGRVQFTSGFPRDLSRGGMEIKLDQEGIKPLWDEAQASGDWYRFDAYAENDADLTIDLFEYMVNSPTGELKLLPDSGGDAQTVSMGRPLSNLFLNNDSTHVQTSNYADSLGNIVSITPNVQSIVESSFYTEETGYDAHRVLDILHSWWVKSLMADPDRNAKKLEYLRKGLTTKAQEETNFDLLHIKIAKENQQAVKPILQEKFKKFGYVLSLDYTIEGINRNVVLTEPDIDGNPIMTFNEEGLYSNRVKSAEVYSNAVVESFLKTTQDPNIKGRFQKAIQDRIKPRQRDVDETDTDYWTSVINDYLKNLIPDFTSIAQFGNSELDWKPADEVGIAIAQIMMDQKPGTTVSDVLIQNGNETQYVLQLDAQAQWNSQSGLGRRKQFVVLNSSDIHMAQPHTLVKEEKAYEGFRLIQRVHHLLDMKIDDTNRAELNNWLTDAIKQTVGDPISFFANEQVLATIPDIAARGVFTAIPTLKRKKQATYEQMYKVPRLLMSINHDCFYIGIGQPQRFLRDDLPTYYFNDAINPGGPTAATLMGGALDQLAWMMNFGMVTDEQFAEIWESIERGIELYRSEGTDAKGRRLAIRQGNKVDYAFQGKHNILAMLLTMGGSTIEMADGKQKKVVDAILEAFGALDEKGDIASLESSRIIVNKKDLGDPRYKVYDYLFGFTETNDKGETVTREGFLTQLIANPDDAGFSDEEKPILISLSDKLQAIGRTEEIKEFFKGAVTPRMYQAGYPGILQGLLGKRDKGELNLTDEEIEMLASLLLRANSIAEMNIVDAVLGYSSTDLKQLRSILLRFKAKQNSTLLGSYVGPMATAKAKDKAARFNSLKNWYERSLDGTVESLARFEGIQPEDVSRLNQFKQDTKARLASEWEERLTKAAEYWGTNAVRDMSSDEYNNFIYELNVILAGGKEAMEDQLMLFALRKRAATPYVLDEEAIKLQQLISTPHISSEDYKRWLNKEIYFRYGTEAASGRNHMVGWWGIGPQGSKFAQPRVLEGDKGDINVFGIWDIKQLDTKTEAEFEDLFLRSVLIELSRFYRPPEATGYTPDMESRTNYFRAVEERSAREIEATERARYYEGLNDSDIVYDEGDITITAKDRRNRNRKISGSVTQRARMRTKLTGSESEPIVLDQRMDGIGALRPAYADIDFTQRGIYALTEAQHRSRVRNNQSVALRIATEKPGDTDPNGFVDKDLRGYVSPWGQENMPYIPQSSEDISSVVSLGNQSGIQMKAIQLQNVLTDFAKANGLDSLLEAKDWTRIFVIKRLKEKALNPSISSLRKIQKSSSTTLPTDRVNPIREAKIRFHDGIIKVAGISSISLSGIKRFSTIDLMANLEERELSIEEINEIKSKYGEEPGWLQVLSWMATKGKVERLMPLQFGINLDPGVIVRGKEGRKGIPGTTLIPVTSFGREIIQVYHIIHNSDVARRIATEMIKGSDLEKTARFDKNGFVILESIDPLVNKKLYEAIWKEVLDHKTELVKEMMTKYNFVLDRTSTLQILTKKPVLTEDQTEESLTIQGITDANTFVQTQVDNPSTLWLFTPDMLTQLLNNIGNYQFISDFERAFQTNKELFQIKSDLDVLVQEEQAQLFEKLREDEEDMNDALLYLHTVEPGSAKPLAISDYRKVDYNNIPRQVLDFGGYMVNEAYFRGSQTKSVANKETNNVSIELLVSNKGTTDLKKVKAIFPTSDMPFVSILYQVMNKGRALGFHEQADQIAEFLYLYSRTERNLIEEEGGPKSRYSGVNASNVVVKLAAMVFELSGNSEAQEALYSYFNFTNQKQIERVKPKVNAIVDAMMFITSTERHEVDPVFYQAKALLERQLSVDARVINDPAFLANLSRISGRPVTPAMRQSVSKAVDEVVKPIVIPTISHEMYNTTVSPEIFTDPDDFITSFGEPADRETASALVSFLNGLVAKGVISERTRDMKLMLVGKLSQTNPEFIKELGFADISSDSESLMSAAKRNGKYILGLNIQLAEKTSETELLFSFAEELIHIARMKFVKNGSAEWNNIVGLFSATRSRGMVREMLQAFNQGKSVENLENQVDYAMDNPDEFFAHVGAFVLLKDVLGHEEVLAKLETRFKDLRAATSIWKRAFFMIKGMAKEILVTFAKLSNDAAYSDLYADAEKAVMAVIGNSHVARPDVGNPDALFNTYKTAATLLHNKVVDPVAEASIRSSKLKIRALETTRSQLMTQLINTPVADVTTRKSLQTQITTLNQDIAKEQQSVQSLDGITFMGISRSQVIEDMDDLRAWQNKSKRRITRQTLLNQGKQRSFITHFITKGMERRGTRVDTPGTLASAFRQNWFRGADERFVSGFVQNGLLNGFNTIEYTWNSPFAPMMVISDLIDQTAATTHGSLASDVSGIANEKYQVDIYAHNILRMWGEIAAEYPDLTTQLRIFEQAVAFSQGTPTSLGDPTQNAYAENFGTAVKLMRDRMIELMRETGLLEKGEENTVDTFPLKLRNFSLLDEKSREDGFKVIRDALIKKNVDNITLNGADSAFSTLALYTSGALPYYNPEEPVFTEDATIITKIKNNFASPKKATTGREAIIKYLIYKIANQKVKDGSILKTEDYVATSSASVIMKDIQEELAKLAYLNREGNVTFNTAFKNMNSDDMNVLVEEYRLNLELAPTSADAMKRLQKVQSNPQGLDFFSIPNQTVNLLPESLDFANSGDIIAIEFLSKMGPSSHLFRNNAFHLSSTDIFVNGSPELKQLFDWHGDSLIKSLARGTGYDLVERTMIQKLVGIPGAFFNIEQILQMLESEVSNEGVQAANFHLLNAAGVPSEQERSRVIMREAIKRARLAHREARGTVTQDDLDMGTALAKIDSLGRDLVSLRYGPNINFATQLVEVPNALLASMTGGDNMITSFFQTLALGWFTVNQWGRNTAWNLYDRLPQRAPGKGTSLRKGYIAGWKFSPLRSRRLNKLAANALWTTEEALSPILPYNLNHSHATSDLIEKMGWWDRAMLRRKRSQSNTMRAVRIAAGAISNRNIMNLIRNGKLIRFRDEYMKTKPQTIAGLQEVAKRANVRGIDQEVLVNLVRSGILEGSAIEALALGEQTFGLYRGVLLDQTLASWETNIHLGRSSPTSFPKLPKMGLSQTEQAIRQARIALAKFMDLDIHRSMVVRKPMDAPSGNNLAINILTYFKSYPALYVAQQILRRGSIASGWKLSIHLFLTALLDLIYNIVLGLARGTLGYEDVLERITKGRKTKVSEITRYVLRHPVFSNNPLSLVTNGIQLAASGRGSGAVGSVAEGALNTLVGDMYKLGYKFYQNPSSWDQNTVNAYKAFGFLLPEELYGLQARVAVMQAFGDASAYHTPGSSNSAFSSIMQQHENYYDGAPQAVLRSMLSNYEQTKKPATINRPRGLSSQDLRTVVENMTKPKAQPQVQPQVQPQAQPQATDPKGPSLEEQATTPMRAPF